MVIYFGYYVELVEEFIGKYSLVTEEIERDFYRFMFEYFVF